MVSKFKTIAFAGALMMAAAPAFAQDMNLNPLGLPLVPNNLDQLPVVGGGGLDLDPLHIFTPAAAPAPAEAPAPAPMMHHHHMMMHHHMMHHHMMKKKMMMEKKPS